MDADEDGHQNEFPRGGRLPDFVEEYMAGERAWWRLLRATGAVDADESVTALYGWMSNP